MAFNEPFVVELDKRTADLLDRLIDDENRFDESYCWNRASFIGWLVTDYFDSVNDALQ